MIKELLKKVGNISQICGVKELRLEGGKKDGMRAAEVRNGCGLEYTVLLDRALEIFDITYKGMNICYQSPSGIVSPAYFDEHDNGFINNWHAGLFTTCGLTCAGMPCVDSEEKLPLHGYMSNIPGDQIYTGMDWKNDDLILRIAGRMVNAKQGGENLILQREILCKYGENRIYIHDRITNFGYHKIPLMLIYHFNFGYPLLDDNSYAIIPSAHIEGRTSESDVLDYMSFHEPRAEYSEQSFYHTPMANEEGDTAAVIVNPEKDFAAGIKFNVSQLKCLIQVKQLQYGNYLTTLEPANCGVEGRVKERELGRLEYIEPGETRNFDLEVFILDGKKEIEDFKNTWIDKLN